MAGNKSGGLAHIPAELSIISGLTASLDALMLSGAKARKPSSKSVAGINGACATEIADLLKKIEGI